VGDCLVLPGQSGGAAELQQRPRSFDGWRRLLQRPSQQGLRLGRRAPIERATSD
jgi:hypothetical protein